MNPVVKDILYNISARAKGLPLKTININHYEILDIFFLPLFHSKYDFKEDYSYLVYSPYSLMEISYEEMETAKDLLDDEIGDDSLDYDYDCHHTIKRGIDWWEDDLTGRILDYAGIRDEYKAAAQKLDEDTFQAKYSLDVMMKKYGWKNIIRPDEDVKFEQTFLRYYNCIIEHKRKKYEELKSFFDDYDQAMFK